MVHRQAASYSAVSGIVLKTQAHVVQGRVRQKLRGPESCRGGREVKDLFIYFTNAFYESIILKLRQENTNNTHSHKCLDFNIMPQNVQLHQSGSTKT